MSRIAVDDALTWIGGLALACAIGLSVRIGLVLPGGAFWTVAMGALFVSGLVASRRQPGGIAARRLLLCGTTAIVWIAGGLALALARHRFGDGNWLIVPDTLMVMLDLALPATIVAVAAVYPDGRTHRRWERWLVRATTLLALAVPPLLLITRARLQPMLAFAWLHGFSGSAPAVFSPVHVATLSTLGDPLSFYARAALGLLPALAAGVLLLRYRRFGPRERRQLRWPLAAAVLVALQPAGNALVSAGALPRAAIDTPVIIAISILAVSLAIGLLRPELFDLDRFVRQSLGYVALWAVIGAIYVGIAAAAGIAASGEGLQVAIAATITVTLLMAPARRALQRRMARWAYGGERLSGPELLRRVGAALEHTLSPHELAATLTEIVRDGLHVDWVRITLGDEAPIVSGLPGRTPTPGSPVGVSAPLIHAGRQLGLLECAPTIPAPNSNELANLAGQAALAMGNAQLAAEVRVRADELAASRTRIVEAEENARRRIERDIHDGIQQELVALIARIGLARQQLERDPRQVRATLEDLQSETRQALADLRELASGIHPSVLGDRGIVDAIESRAARLPLGVTIECDRSMRETRFPAAVEGAAYFTVCEGFANALKHSGAERVTVRLGHEGGVLRIEISDDGCGFAPDDTARSGLDGLADRTEALGGSFAVSSGAGAGTTLRASFPAAAKAAV